MNRFQAFAIHLAISLTLGASMFALIFFVWYPSPLFTAMGGSELALLILSIDVVLGPLLTLVVFNTKKRSLKMDLGIIASLQLAAFVYGAWIVFIARPVFVVVRGDFAIVMTAGEINQESQARAQPEFQAMPWFGPREAAVSLQQTPEERRKVIETFMSTGADLENLPEYYRPLPALTDEILARAKPIEEAVTAKPAIKEELDAWIRRHGWEGRGLAFVYLRTRYTEYLYLFDRQDRRALGIAPIDVSQ